MLLSSESHLVVPFSYRPMTSAKACLSHFFGDGRLAYFGASFVSGALVVFSMNPFDVVSSRMYNEKTVGGKGVYYKGPIDCFLKTIRAEGLSGLYKGAWAHYLV